MLGRTGEDVDGNSALVLVAVFQAQESKLRRPAHERAGEENPLLPVAVVSHGPESQQEHAVEGEDEAVADEHDGADVDVCDAELDHAWCEGVAAIFGRIVAVEASLAKHGLKDYTLCQFG